MSRIKLMTVRHLSPLSQYDFDTVERDVKHQNIISSSSRLHFENIFFFPQKTGFDISCKLFPKKTICMKCQSLFSGWNMKNVINLSSAPLAQKVVKIKMVHSWDHYYWKNKEPYFGKNVFMCLKGLDMPDRFSTTRDFLYPLLHTKSFLKSGLL